MLYGWEPQSGAVYDGSVSPKINEGPAESGKIWVRWIIRCKHGSGSQRRAVL